MADTEYEVIFRKFKKGGDIIAIFPAIPWTSKYNKSCMSYMHVGQHGDCVTYNDPSVTQPATPKEYKELKKELVERGYKKIKVVKRFTEKHRLARKAMTE